MWVLTFVKNNKAIPLLEKTSIQDLQRERTKLSKYPQYKNGKLVVRTIAGFKAIKILNSNKNSNNLKYNK